jgi:hypothetical protein
MCKPFLNVVSYWQQRIQTRNLDEAIIAGDASFETGLEPDGFNH